MIKTVNKIKDVQAGVGGNCLKAFKTSTGKPF